MRAETAEVKIKALENEVQISSSPNSQLTNGVLVDQKCKIIRQTNIRSQSQTSRP
jgi:hypothetical protein